MRIPLTFIAAVLLGMGPAAAGDGFVVRLQGVHPAVREGLELTCHGNRVRVSGGKATVDGKTVAFRRTELPVKPADIVSVADWPITLTAEKVQTWHLGNRLVIQREKPRNLLNGSYVAGSLRLFVPGRPELRPAAPADFVVEDLWGAFSLPPGSRLHAGDRVTASYRLSQRRIDSIVLDRHGNVRLVEGKPSADCPEWPVALSGTLILANLYRPFQATVIEPHQVYVPAAHPRLREAPRDGESLAGVLQKLRAGGDVTIVCWGDSVTVGLDVEDPAKIYVRRFEEELKARFPDARIRVVNAGIDGSNTSGRLPKFQTEVLDHRPDLVTLEFINDMGLRPEVRPRNYSEILQRTRDAGAALLLITPHFSMPSWMPLPHGRGKDPRPGVAFLRRFAGENRIPLADAAARWEELESLGLPYETLLANGINHPDARGHDLFVQELLRFFPQ